MENHYFAQVMRMGQVCLKNLQILAFALTVTFVLPTHVYALSGGDTLKITFEVSGWVNNATQMEATIDLSGYDIDSESKPTLGIDGSWFVSPTESYSYDLLWDTTKQEIYLRLTRSSGSASGIGKVAEIGGLVIMDDVMVRRPAPVMEPDEIYLQPVAGPNPYVQSASPQLYFSNPPESVELWTLEGKLISSRLDDLSLLLREGLQPGYYLLRTTRRGRSYQQRILVKE